jgi:hypothetical protein
MLNYPTSNPFSDSEDNDSEDGEDDESDDEEALRWGVDPSV